MFIEASKSLVIFAALVAVLWGAAAVADEPTEHRYTFSWQFADEAGLAPRGGSSRGAPVELDQAPSDAWLALQAADIDKFERDRRAILAMAGPYRASFDFLETVRYVASDAPPNPYQSWGTEYVYVAEDDGDFISLQHLLVMFYFDERGELNGPHVMKHWRQDWTYEDEEMLEYVGHDTWRTRELSEQDIRGTWSQAVSQVDDAPRYEGFGAWTHTGSFSAWTSETTWRPLPRREYSVRSDYQVLEGINTHTIVPTGWVHEQNNLKLVLDGDGMPAAATPYLARELGVARYDRLEGFDFSAGHEYWEQTSRYWKAVRDRWQRIAERSDSLSLSALHEGQSLYERLFVYAERVARADEYDERVVRRFVEETLAMYVVSD